MGPPARGGRSGVSMVNRFVSGKGTEGGRGEKPALHCASLKALFLKCQLMGRTPWSREPSCWNNAGDMSEGSAAAMSAHRSNARH